MVYCDIIGSFEHVCFFANSYFMIKDNRKSYSFFIFILFLILVGIITAFVKESYQKFQLNKEINGLKNEAELLREKNKVLSNLLNYFNSEKSLEKEARLKLNFGKEGEKLVVISPQEKSNLESQSLEDIQKKGLSNFEKWLEYFGLPW